MWRPPSAWREPPSADLEAVEWGAGLIYGVIERAAGAHWPEPGGECPATLQPEEVLLEVYRARRGEVEPWRAAWRIACSLARAVQGRFDLLTAGLGLAGRPRRPGLLGLARLVYDYYTGPSVDKLIAVAEAVGGEISAPCRVDPEIEAERERLESRLKAAGGALGLALAGLFAAGFLANPLIGIAALVVAAAVWAGVASVGRRFHALNVESGWRSCSLDPSLIEEAIRGPRLPSAFEILGLPRPEL